MAGSVPDSQNMLTALLGQDAKGSGWLVEHAGSPAPKLYDRATDNLAGQNPERVKAMTERLPKIRTRQLSGRAALAWYGPGGPYPQAIPRPFRTPL